MERLHTQGGEALGERRQGGWGEDAVVVKETTRVPVCCPLLKVAVLSHRLLNLWLNVHLLKSGFQQFWLYANFLVTLNSNVVKNIT